MTIPINISHAGDADVPALVSLINLAYSGGGDAQRGWTAEADLFTGGVSRKRTDEDAIRTQLTTPGAIMFKCTAPNGNIVGCEYLEQQGNKLYLGMLSVLPGLQGGGVGKQLLAAAEDYARSRGCISVIMTVISVRYELITWYERHGYQKTGKTAPFPNDNRHGVPVQPLEFLVLEKKV